MKLYLAEIRHNVRDELGDIEAAHRIKEKK